MNINIYYGGRGLVDDPTIFAINKIQEVLNELNVNVTRYNHIITDNNRSGWCYFCDNCGMGRYGWLYADSAGFMLVIFG